MPLPVNEVYADLDVWLMAVDVALDTEVLRKVFVGSTGLPLFEHDKQTLNMDFSIITFLLTSVCFPHNSQKETICMDE
ncbi:protein of unknown function [Candidatus Nitrosocosmicus franklandus]|uniref:Uncharacterized protein n=1 Tax=Candidatus Nitrosocosmicus franklandianus TaxID=1798806 RepID=A0A484I929_9ARCH|nr:protein of unknown function [Candidatus Nitrosocosmicus franklandus]